MNYNFSGFIWAPAIIFTDEILEYINKTLPLLHYYTYDFKNNETFEKSILDIYTTDDIDPNKVKNVKLKSMRNYPLNYTYFKFYIANPNFRKKQATGNNISRVVEDIKKKIRILYKNKIKNYIYDIIIHISDNYQQTKDIDIIMKKYEEHRLHEFINLKFFLKCNFKKNIFNRADVLVRKYSIEQYLNDKNYDFNFYKKMQKRRRHSKTTKYKDIFKKLINSLLNNGFNKNKPILYSNNYLLRDGSHRLSYLYMTKAIFIPIKYKKWNNHPQYSINWFKINKFNNKELNILKNELKELDIYINS